ncbi:MAG: methyltransferase, partial [Xanthomonadales bacterium]|nr:methyltransferase [Xanthomonadales bacterium]
MARRGRKSGRRSAAAGIRQLPWRQPVNPYPPAEILPADDLERIHETSLDLLENQGMRVLHEESRRLLAAAGAEVDETSETVRFDRHLVMEQLRQAPPEFTLHARNPAKNIRIGGR